MKKIHAKQMALGFDTRPRIPQKHEHEVDFSRMQIGHMVGNEDRIIRCPMCARNCIVEEKPRHWQFVHRATIQSTACRVRFVPDIYCVADLDDMRALEQSKQVVRNRLGQILEVKAAQECPA